MIAPLRSEDGRFHLGADSCAPGEARALSNAYGLLDCARSGVSTAVDDLVVDWALSVRPGHLRGHARAVDGR
ncbi:MAG: hypothetical protein M5U28_34695 [Sandaracinaceae bacterium]|nr:hypothetical protein [Sandaracinaceae bacterium]